MDKAFTLRFIVLLEFDMQHYPTTQKISSTSDKVTPRSFI